MKKLAIITTHPIQYNAPFFKLFSEKKEILLKVFYTWEQSKEKVYDEKFKKEIKWNIPLLKGYAYTFVKNISKTPGSGTYKGVINPTLNREVENWHADYILIYGWNHQSHLKAMKYFKGKIPVYFRGDSTLIDEVPGIKTFLRRIWLTYIYKHIDAAFYVGTNNKNYYLKHGVKAEQLIYAPHAVDNERFFDNNGDYEKKATIWKKELGYKETDFIFLYAGKYEPKKNPLFLIETAKVLKDSFFLFVGSGELEDKMKLASLGLKNVKFLPFQNQSEMPIVYRLGDVFVLPSVGPQEQWGMAINEALACDIPVIVSEKVGCAKDLVIENETGYIFSFKNKPAFITDFIKFANQHNHIKNKLKTKTIINRFSFDVTAFNIIEELKK